MAHGKGDYDQGKTICGLCTAWQKGLHSLLEPTSYAADAINRIPKYMDNKQLYYHMKCRQNDSCTVHFDLVELTLKNLNE